MLRQYKILKYDNLLSKELRIFLFSFSVLFSFSGESTGRNGIVLFSSIHLTIPIKKQNREGQDKQEKKKKGPAATIPLDCLGQFFVTKLYILRSFNCLFSQTKAGHNKKSCQNSFLLAFCVMDNEVSARNQLYTIASRHERLLIRKVNAIFYAR